LNELESRKYNPARFPQTLSHPKTAAMSEYQYYEFAAIDGPISDEGLRYARSCLSAISDTSLGGLVRKEEKCDVFSNQEKVHHQRNSEHRPNTAL
jgi:hypothetical protein